MVTKISRKSGCLKRGMLETYMQIHIYISIYMYMYIYTIRPSVCAQIRKQNKHFMRRAFVTPAVAICFI